MGLLFSMGERNTQVGARIPQSWNVKDSTNMGYELRTGIFIENDTRFIKVYSLARGLTEFMQHG